MPSPRDLKLMLAAAAGFLGLTCAVFLGGVSADLLLCAPVFVLVVPLLGGRYVGEELVDRLRCAYVARRRRPRASAATPGARRPVFSAAPSGRLVAGAFRCRPPPQLVPAP